MTARRDFLTGLAAAPFFAASLAAAYGCAKPAFSTRKADPTFRVFLDGPAPAKADFDSAQHAAWARLEQGTPFAPQIDAGEASTTKAVPIRGVGAKRDGSVGVVLTNASDSPARLELTVPLALGLWRAEVAVAPKPTADLSVIESQLRTWRMESVFQKADAEAKKTLPLAPGQTLLVRWTETVGEATQARRQVREANARTRNDVLQSRVARAMEPIDDTLAVLPELIRRGDRDKMVRRVHTALLATAKAQALWQNWRDASLVEMDTAFSDLVNALSEISCSAHNLVPAQTVVRGENGKPDGLRVSAVNAGPRKISLVALGLSHNENGKNGDLKVFRPVLPGATVTATFPLPEGGTDARGIVQFISDMGAAVVIARPAP